MRVLTSVIARAALAMLHPGQDLALVGTITVQLLRDDNAGYIG
jgi:hypothetical protein